VNEQPELAPIVRELRNRLDLAQEQFAQKVGVTFSSVNHWENGKRTPQPFLVRRLLETKEELDLPAPRLRQAGAEQQQFSKRKSE